jgi:hypothetical protein
VTTAAKIRRTILPPKCAAGRLPRHASWANTVDVRRWTTAALYPDELGWLREALALNAEETDDEDEDDDLEPLL